MITIIHKYFQCLLSVFKALEYVNVNCSSLSMNILQTVHTHMYILCYIRTYVYISIYRDLDRLNKSVGHNLGTLTALIECVTSVLEYTHLRPWQTFERAWALPCLTLATPLLVYLCKYNTETLLIMYVYRHL